MEIEQIAKMQRKYYETGKTKSLKYRMAALNRLEQGILKWETEIKRALKKDLNKSAFEAYMTEIGMTLSELHYVKKHLKQWTKDTVVKTPLAQFPAKSYVKKEPYGIVLIMSPWNYPFMLCIEPLIGALAAGNCCVLKPSDYAPSVSSVIRRMIEDIFPKKYVTVVEGGRAENKELLEQQFDYIFFTGSVQVGKLVMKKAAEHLTPVTLELGGKSPCIVEKTADLKLAAKRLVFGKFLNAGQTCVAPDYLLVQKEVKEEFLKYVVFWINKMYGESSEYRESYPKIINEKHFRRICKLIEGEEILIGGVTDEAALQIAPTVLDHVKPEAPVMQEEIFGPVLPVLEFEHIQEAEQFVRERSKPLALYLFTNDKKIEKRITEHLSYGGGCINDTIVHLATPYMGFGGVGASGMGCYHGKDSFETFSHKKSIIKKYNLLDNPVRYVPYGKTKEKIMRCFWK